MEKEKYGTASRQVAGWYVEFQMAVLRALPRDIEQEVADGWRGNGEALAKNLRGVLIPTEPVVPTKPEFLLEPLSIITVPATTGKFVARDRFVVNTGHKAPVEISFVGSNFSEWFFGNIEEPTGEITLRYAKLLKSSVDSPIISELGGEEKSETTLAEIYALMERQGKGEDGVLLTNRYANIFYVRDFNGALRAVFVDWRGDGWDVRADSVEDPDAWDDGHRVFSRNS